MGSKLQTLRVLLEKRKAYGKEGKKVVFTNGCFDILHAGHVHLLREAKKLGDVLIVAVNDDASVRRIKGPQRPVFPLAERMEVLEAIAYVDHLLSFDDETPRKIIRALLPDVLVKGGDWKPEEVVGKDEVEQAGGRVVVIPHLRGHSTSAILERIIASGG